MLITTDDPRPAWWRLAARAELTELEKAELAALPTGAREAPLAWLFELEQHQHGYFDKDEQGEVVVDVTHVMKWRSQPDPRVERAATLSLYGCEVPNPEALIPWPGRAVLGAGLRVLELPGKLARGPLLDALDTDGGWEDLVVHSSIPASQWPGVVDALARGWTSLRGLDLTAPRLDVDACARLAATAWWSRLEDLGLGGGVIDPRAVGVLLDRLGPLRHLDLRGLGIDAYDWSTFAAKLRTSRRLQLADNALRDVGGRALLDGGAFDRVEDLWLSDCGLGDAFVDALCERDPPALRGLWLHGNAITRAGLATLARSRLLARLDGLSLFHNPGAREAGDLLVDHPLAGALSGTERVPGVTALWFAGR